MFSIQTILHPTDFSAASGYALGVASALASDYGANLVIVHVAAAPLGLPGGGVFAHPDPEALRAQLAHLEVPAERIEVVRRLEEGNPAREILSLAQLCQADVIVIGAHGRRGLSRRLLGSVADAVMRQAACPVLIVTSPVPVSSPRPGER